MQQRSPSRESNAPVTHIIGAGLAGLAAAVRLAEQGRPVAVYEAAGQAGGRCRSYFDAGFGAVIDNGNHLLLSGNEAAIRYLTLVGGADRLRGPPRAEFDFADLRTGERWTLKINEGRWPSWLFDRGRRVPATKPLDYLAAAPLMWAGRRRAITDIIAGEGPLYERLWQPLMLAALNTDPHEGSARLAAAIMRNTLAKGGAACRPLIAEGLSAAFIEPALAYLGERYGTISFGKRLREIEFASGRVRSLKFNDSEISIREGEAIILAVPPWVAQTLVPGLRVPTE
ncbi:MAG: FAD-dependent oxidoreductase, partial [Rhodomicrobium sp.]